MYGKFRSRQFLFFFVAYIFPVKVDRKSSWSGLAGLELKIQKCLKECRVALFIVPVTIDLKLNWNHSDKSKMFEGNCACFCSFIFCTDLGIDSFCKLSITSIAIVLCYVLIWTWLIALAQTKNCWQKFSSNWSSVRGTLSYHMFCICFNTHEEMNHRLCDTTQILIGICVWLRPLLNDFIIGSTVHIHSIQKSSL